MLCHLLVDLGFVGLAVFVKLFFERLLLEVEVGLFKAVQIWVKRFFDFFSLASLACVRGDLRLLPSGTVLLLRDSAVNDKQILG